MASICAVVHDVRADQAATVEAMRAQIPTITTTAPRLVAFGEACTTGSVSTDTPVDDWHLGSPIPGSTIECFGRLARHSKAWLVAGIYESANQNGARCMYDSAVLLDPTGEIQLLYRRISPQWHGPDADPEFYRQGTDTPVALTPFGRTGLLICGDLFDDRLIGCTRSMSLDLLVVPFARGFDSDVADRDAWQDVERQVYADRAVAAGAKLTVLVNTLDPRAAHPTFGGALVIDQCGQIVAELPIETAGAVTHTASGLL